MQRRGAVGQRRVDVRLLLDEGADRIQIVLLGRLRDADVIGCDGRRGDGGQREEKTGSQDGPADAHDDASDE